MTTNRPAGHSNGADTQLQSPPQPQPRDAPEAAGTSVEDGADELSGDELEQVAGGAFPVAPG